MSCKTETKEISDNEYSVTQWPATKALLMKFKLIKVLGPAVASLASSGGGEDVKALGEGLTELFKNNDPQEVVDIMKSTIVGVGINGSKMDESTFESTFSGDDLIDIYKVFIFVVKVNYGNLFKGQWAESLLAKTNLAPQT